LWVRLRISLFSIDYYKGAEMEELSRRMVLGLAAAGLAVEVLDSRRSQGNELTKAKQTVPVLHVTDLFRPHMDPDDHWDLACVYALAHRGDINLKGVLIDYPPTDDRNPDIMAVAQMNLICGLFVPVGVGSGHPLKSRNDTQPHTVRTDHHGVSMILDTLEQSARPIVINILGSSRDVAIAAKKDPDLFAAKCAAIYLNAGTGSPEMSPASKLEYNVTLDTLAYAAIFDLPCPIYWMPCFEQMESRRERSVQEYGTYYQFQQDRILPHLSKDLQNYFAYMFGKYTDDNWMHYLMGPRDEALLSRVGDMTRHMWCTAGFFHAAGYTVTGNGKIVRLDENPHRPVFTFDPITVRCADNGVTKWRPDAKSKHRFIFHVRDMDHYQSAMIEAMRSLLMTLP
jgi:Inosine-uridine preferring nucleoside hydrolase